MDWVRSSSMLPASTQACVLVCLDPVAATPSPHRNPTPSRRRTKVRGPRRPCPAPVREPVRPRRVLRPPLGLRWLLVPADRPRPRFRSLVVDTKVNTGWCPQRPAPWVNRPCGPPIPLTSTAERSITIQSHREPLPPRQHPPTQPHLPRDAIRGPHHPPHRPDRQYHQLAAGRGPRRNHRTARPGRSQPA